MVDITTLTRRIGTAIRRERKRRGVSQQRLADQIGCDRSLLSHLELGRASPTITMLVKIALALSIDVMQLLPEDVAGLGLSSTELRLVQTYRTVQAGSPVREVCRLIAYADEEEAG